MMNETFNGTYFQNGQQLFYVDRDRTQLTGGDNHMAGIIRSLEEISLTIPTTTQNGAAPE